MNKYRTHNCSELTENDNNKNVNLNLKTIKSVAATGVDRISIGSITHSAPAIDFKLEI